MAQPGLSVNAHRFTQGGHDVYSFILNLPALDRLLPLKADERVEQETDHDPL